MVGTKTCSNNIKIYIYITFRRNISSLPIINISKNLTADRRWHRADDHLSRQS